jgi:hypothetical protein
MGAAVPVPAGAIPFAVSALPSIAKRMRPTLRCPRYVARLLVRTDGSALRHHVSMKRSKDTE